MTKKGAAHTAALIALGVAALLASTVTAVDRNKFKKCEQSGFCRRNRNRFTAENPVPAHLSSFALGVFAPQQGERMVAPVAETLPSLFAGKEQLWPKRKLEATVRAYEGGIFRVTVTESGREDGLAPRYSPEDEVVEKSLKQVPLTLTTEPGTGRQVFSAASAGEQRATLVLPAAGEGFGFELRVPAVDGTNAQAAATVISAKNMLFENHMKKPVRPEPPKVVAEGPLPKDSKDDHLEVVDKDEEAKAEQQSVDIDGAWDESFGGKTDGKPNGPGAVGLDVQFPGSTALYGVPEHASQMALKDTHSQYREPYRLFNADVFEYELDETMALYGAVPLVLAHDSARGTTAGMLWLNPSETWVDVSLGSSSSSKEVRWTSEDGTVDAWLFSGPGADDVLAQYTAVTGRPFLPPYFATAYHQCRWNYNSQDDVREVDEGFDAHNIPYDVIWLDIEHTNGKRYFTWDSSKFGRPEEMQANLSAKGRRLVTIVDPHIKRDSGYDVHKEATEGHHYVKRADGSSDYEGHCWPGTSSWVDFMSADARRWWAERFALDKYRGSSTSLFIWNDMNEPAIFSGPETTMERDAKHHGGLEHRQVHNMYGLMNTRATYDGLLRRAANARPFVLTRSFFAGSQKYAAVWTGDNMAKWEHLRAMVPMVLSLNLAGIVFSGADVAGFFGNPPEELLVRWYQAGALVPFFRAHAHIETARREPWLFSNQTTDLIRAAVLRRYRLLPYLYTAFRASTATGAPIARALWTAFPTDPASDTVDNEYLLGTALLVHPVTEQGAKSVSVYLPAGVWYDTDTLQPSAGPATIQVATPLAKVPLFYRGGSVVPTRQRQRRSTTQMVHDPYTLFVAPDAAGKATGSLYIDDGSSFDYRTDGKAAYDLLRFELATHSDGTRVLTGSAQHRAYPADAAIERIVLLGVPQRPRSVTASTGAPVAFAYDSAAHVLTLKKPVADALVDWQITVAL